MHMMENSSLYNLHELHHASMMPLKMLVNVSKHLHRHPLMPFSYTDYGRTVAAAAEVVERITHRYGKPEFGIKHTHIGAESIAIHEDVVQVKPFCRLLHFRKESAKKQPKMLLVAPMSGHHATLLRGTVEGLLPHVDLYITDWLDAREVAVIQGDFDMDDYIEYVMDFLHLLGPDVHVMAVCQPSVPVLAAVALMSQEKNPALPRSMTLVGGPIDTRVNPTKVNKMAEKHSLSWFEQHVITRVPYNYPGFMRRVYPGFLQLTGFMSLNLDRHIDEHVNLFKHLVQGDGESAAMHKKFYNEYLSVADLPAEFYLQSIDRVFQRHLLPKGELAYRGEKINPAAITKTALLTLEGELDDISGVGQTEAAQHICTNIPQAKRKHHLQPKVGHYGIFNGRRFREHVVPVIMEFIGKSA